MEVKWYVHAMREGWGGGGGGCEVTMRCGRKKVCVGMEEDKEWKGWYVVGLSHVNHSPAKT